jgi:hypothetical protein
MGQAMQPGTEDIGPEDLTGFVTSGTNGSLAPWAPQQQGEPRRFPDALKLQRERLRLVAIERHGRGAAWFRIPDEVRALLIALCTERGTDRAHLIKWQDLTEDEQIVIGVQARALVRGLAGAAESLR